MKKPYNFAEYDLIFDNRKNNNLYKVVIALFMIVIIIIICKFKFYIYENNILFKNGDNYELVVDINNINEISTGNNIIINKQQYKYNIISIDNNISNINGTIFENISINIPNYTNDNKILKCSFLKKKGTLLDILLEFIQGG